MKNRLRIVAAAAIVCGLAAGSLAVWSYYRARTEGAESVTLREKSYELYDRSDEVKGTPEETRLVGEGQKYERDADLSLDSAKASRRRAMMFGIGSLVLIIIFIAATAAHLRKKDADGN